MNIEHPEKHKVAEVEWLYMISAITYWNRAQAGDLSLARKELEAFPSPRSSYPALFWILQEGFEGRPKAVLDRIQNATDSALDFQSSHELVTLAKGRARTAGSISRRTRSSHRFGRGRGS